MPRSRRTGHITLVGGGPGPADLLTLRAAKALAAADVVYFDRLGPTSDLAELAPRATFVDVGKTPGHHKVPQEEITARMIDGAKAGLHVVRLKGGDPFVFGRGGEEMAGAVAAGIGVTVVPGISSAISVPGAAGIPVTHRNVSHLFTVVSGHAPLQTSEYTHLAGLGGTIVVLMGIGTLPSLVAGLRLAGLATGTPVAIVENGFSHAQRTTIATLGTIVEASSSCRNPAVIVIGEVVKLAGQHGMAIPNFLADANLQSA
ncbi:uroporphyrin-III C-methyltransferase [Arthrobacter alpinus]|uniref:uroporphyrinogen-III C-methyltransferase n=1 Tax=Arthrobacter alpinus TaxID=656366 RepID=A0A0U3PY44_9MICC|nr:uroporphyrinogen-III C-methyltransferase [Arthrobacter alpinus]ALV47352.1 uroporphyrin-III methyltransferase [Arthrobacter alpinus]SEE62979.1 uroporphyrin-III C-methyltransferase [Arthrobacter alpinus]